MSRLLCFATVLGILGTLAHADEKLKDIACRSVHLQFEAPEAVAFYNEVEVNQSAPGTYFCVCGFGMGYYGLQELGDGKKLLIFSVWDPGKQDDPNTVTASQRVKLVHQGEGVRVGRFGNEGTGGQSFFDYDWKVGTTYRFLVTARIVGDRTEYAGSFFVPETKQWKHIVTFSTLSGGRLLGGPYSFIEDFRRDRVSATRPRQARYGPGWVESKDGEWLPIKAARFTADSNPVTNIDATLSAGRFRLATGGKTENTGARLNDRLVLEGADRILPEDVRKAADTLLSPGDGQSHTTDGQARRFLAGGDISMLTAIEEAGGTFRDGDQAGDLIEILTRHGWNGFRLRLFVNPDHKDDGVVNDLPYTIALAKRIKAAGATFLLDFHYSDTWADPQKQGKPAAWRDLDFDSLEKQVGEYTRQAVTELKAAGATPDVVQVGNEITPGMLWPEGRIQGDDPESWHHFTRLVKAGIRGVREALGPHDPVRIMIHIDRGGDAKTTRWFLDHLQKEDVAYDLLGESYYPWWHGSLEDLKITLRETANRYGKDLVVVETAYPWTGSDWWSKQKNMAWPISPEGQRAFLADVAEAVRATPGGHGIGVIYWYPEGVPTTKLRVWNGGATALFDHEARALPGVEALRADKRKDAP